MIHKQDGYQHLTDALRSQVASQVGELIWGSAISGVQGTAHAQLACEKPAEPDTAWVGPPASC